jgi:hypothetical protein
MTEFFPRLKTGKKVFFWTPKKVFFCFREGTEKFSVQGVQRGSKESFLFREGSKESFLYRNLPVYKQCKKFIKWFTKYTLQCF